MQIQCSCCCGLESFSPEGHHVRLESSCRFWIKFGLNPPAESAHSMVHIFFSSTASQNNKISVATLAHTESLSTFAAPCSCASLVLLVPRLHEDHNSSSCSPALSSFPSSALELLPVFFSPFHLFVVRFHLFAVQPPLQSLEASFEFSDFPLDFRMFLVLTFRWS